MYPQRLGLIFESPRAQSGDLGLDDTVFVLGIVFHPKSLIAIELHGK